MANVEIHGSHGPGRDVHDKPDRTRDAAVGTSFAEALVGVAAVVLAILGLAGVLPLEFASVATILVGAALLMESGAIAARIYESRNRFGGGETLRDVAGGMSAESLAGLSGVVLGILSLLRIGSFVLLPVAAIVIGVGLLFGTAAASHVNSLTTSVAEPSDASAITRESIYAASDAHVLVGLAALVLGIIALLSSPIATLVLTLVAMLSLGATVALSGAAIGGRLMTALHH